MRPSDRAPSYGPCGQAMEKLTLPHRLPTLAALAPTPSPLLQQRFMKKETSPVPDRARIAPSSQELRLRNNPVKSPGGSTRECEKQHPAPVAPCNNGSARHKGVGEPTRYSGDATASRAQRTPQVSRAADATL